MADAYHSNMDAFYASQGLIGQRMLGMGAFNRAWYNKYLTYASDIANYSKDREIQKKEFEAIQGATKTENYTTAISDDDRARAVAAEEELLGERIASMGKASLFGGLR